MIITGTLMYGNVLWSPMLQELVPRELVLQELVRREFGLQPVPQELGWAARPFSPLSNLFQLHFRFPR